MTRMKRRDFITLLGGAAAWPLAAAAEQPRTPVVGFLGAGHDVAGRCHADMIRAALEKVGYRDGSNYHLDCRWAGFERNRLPELASGLVDRRVDVILARGEEAARAAQRATATIPIVFTMEDDPVRLGCVASYDHPGNNVTGITGKMSVIAELADSLGFDDVSCIRYEFFDREVERFAREKARHRPPWDRADIGYDRVTVFAPKQCRPYFGKEIHVAMLVSYGPNSREMERRVAQYADLILRGADPAQLPVAQPRRFELVLNLQNAKRLGIEVPGRVLALESQVNA